MPQGLSAAQETVFGPVACSLEAIRLAQGLLEELNAPGPTASHTVWDCGYQSQRDPQTPGQDEDSLPSSLLTLSTSLDPRTILWEGG